MPWKKLGNFFSLTSCHRQVNKRMLQPLQLPDSDISSGITGVVLAMFNASDLPKNGAMLHRILRESYNNGDIPSSYDESVAKWILVASIVLQIITILVIMGLWYHEMSSEHEEDLAIRRDETLKQAQKELNIEENKQR